MFKLLLGDPNARKLKRFQPLVYDINLLEEDIAPLSDEDMRAKTTTFKEALAKAETPQLQRADGTTKDGIEPEVDEKQRNVVLTDEGYAKAEQLLEVGDLFNPEAPRPTASESSLSAFAATAMGLLLGNFFKVSWPDQLCRNVQFFWE